MEPFGTDERNWTHEEKDIVRIWLLLGEIMNILGYFEWYCFGCTVEKILEVRQARHSQNCRNGLLSWSVRNRFILKRIQSSNTYCFEANQPILVKLGLLLAASSAPSFSTSQSSGKHGICFLLKLIVVLENIK